jgi:hypothetical protein
VQLKNVYKRRRNPYSRGIIKNFLSLVFPPLYPRYLHTDVGTAAVEVLLPLGTHCYVESIVRTQTLTQSQRRAIDEAVALPEERVSLIAK